MQSNLLAIAKGNAKSVPLSRLKEVFNVKKKRILALFLAAVSCLSLAVSASAAGTVNRKVTDFRDFDKSAWYDEAVSAAVDNGLCTANPARCLTRTAI